MRSQDNLVDEVLGYHEDGSDFTRSDLDDVLMEAEEEYRNGTMMTLEEFEKEIES